MDILGPLPTSNKGNEYILVVMDYFTRFAWAFPISSTTTADVAELIANNINCQFGSFTKILSDRGKNFISELAKDIYKLLGTKKKNTSAYHPQTDGLAERFMHTLSYASDLYK